MLDFSIKLKIIIFYKFLLKPNKVFTKKVWNILEDLLKLWISKILINKFFNGFTIKYTLK